MRDARDYKYKSTGSHVRELQKKLSEAGYEVSVDGIFGDETRNAIEELEGDLSLAEDSYSFAIDRVTLSHLFLEEEEKKESLLYPKGKGMFVRSYKHFGDLSLLPKWLKDHNISWIAINRIRQNFNKKDRLLNMKNWESWVELLESVNCDLWVWGWPQPNKIDSFVKEMEEARETWRATGLIADVEGDFYNHRSEAEDLARKMLALGCPVGISSYGYPEFHKRFPFTAFLDFDFCIPQIYEQNPNYEYDLDYPKQCLDQWKSLGYKKCIPASSSFKGAEGMENLLSRTPVEDSIVWWDWHNANLQKKRWEVIKNYDKVS